MKRACTRVGLALTVVAMGAATLATGVPAQALANPASPQLAYERIITSHPFSGAPGNASDLEGLGSVPADNSLWVADDNADRIWEIDATTGAFKSQLRDGVSGFTDFRTATQVGTGHTCAQALDAGIPGDTGANECLSRTDDFESVVYDPTADVLYATSGGCCTAGLPSGYPMHPTVWKLTRQGGHFRPSQWQALPEGQDPTAAGWRPGVGFVFGKGSKIKTYDFATQFGRGRLRVAGLEHRRAGVHGGQHRIRDHRDVEHGVRTDHRVHRTPRSTGSTSVAARGPRTPRGGSR